MPRQGNSAPAGSFNVLSGATLTGAGGTLTLDIAQLTEGSGQSTKSLKSLQTALTSGEFTQSQSIRVRTGDVTVDGTSTASSFSLATDAGSIDVSGTIDASGSTGGTIDLAAHGASGGNLLTADGQLLAVPLSVNTPPPVWAMLPVPEMAPE